MDVVVDPSDVQLILITRSMSVNQLCAGVEDISQLLAGNQSFPTVSILCVYISVFPVCKFYCGCETAITIEMGSVLLVCHDLSPRFTSSLNRSFFLSICISRSRQIAIVGWNEPPPPEQQSPTIIIMWRKSANRFETNKFKVYLHSNRMLRVIVWPAVAAAAPSNVTTTLSSIRHQW